MTNDPRLAYSGKARKSLEELHELINLAEQVTYDLTKARSAAWRQIGFVFIILMLLSSIVLIITLNQPRLIASSANITIPSLISGLGIGVTTGTYAVAVITMLINQRKWRLERQIVTEILVMASSILDVVQVDIGSVEYTVLRMRMRRLGLSEGGAIAGIRFA